MTGQFVNKLNNRPRNIKRAFPLLLEFADKKRVTIAAAVFAEVEGQNIK